MDAKNAINSILHNATGRRASGRELLISEKKSILEHSAATTLKEQWKSAGRDHARVVMMLTEHDGSNPHFVTGWDGKDTFVCLTDQGLSHVNYRNLEKLKVERRWNPNTRLIEVRAHQISEDYEMSGPDVDMLVDRIKKTLKKSNKQRRKGRLRNMEKFFSFAVVEDEDTVNEFERVKEKDDRVPEAPKEPSTTKLPKDAKSKQSYRESWDLKDRAGAVRRRGLVHPMMQENQTDPQLDKRELVRMDGESGGSSGSATSGGNKTDAQQDKRELVDMRHEDKCDPQLDKRELVHMNSEGKGGSPGATPGGNKTDAQQDKRELVDMRHEEKTLGAGDKSDKSDDCDHLTYAGEKVTDKEFSARPKIAVRHEALTLKSDAKKRFGPGNKKMPDPKAKKPLLLMVLMSKGKGKGKCPPSRPMGEASAHDYCPSCRVREGLPAHPSPENVPHRAKRGELAPVVDPFPKPCPSCRKQSGGGLKLRAGIKKPPSGFFGSESEKKDAFESSYHPSRLSNINKIQRRARRRYS